jgi:hypothetical protein
MEEYLGLLKSINPIIMVEPRFTRLPILQRMDLLSNNNHRNLRYGEAKINTVYTILKQRERLDEVNAKIESGGKVNATQSKRRQ